MLENRMQKWQNTKILNYEKRILKKSTSWGWAGPSSAKDGAKLGIASSENSARIR